MLRQPEGLCQLEQAHDKWGARRTMLDLFWTVIVVVVVVVRWSDVT
jgi:hypothetical protein